MPDAPRHVRAFLSSGVLAGLLASAFAAIPVTAAAAGPLDGAWSQQGCDLDMQANACAGFSLVLVGEGDDLCGEHRTALLGVGRIDEGGLGSVMGVIDGDGMRATLVVRAASSGARYLAIVERLPDTAPGPAASGHAPSARAWVDRPWQPGAPAGVGFDGVPADRVPGDGVAAAPIERLRWRLIGLLQDGDTDGSLRFPEAVTLARNRGLAFAARVGALAGRCP